MNSPALSLWRVAELRCLLLADRLVEWGLYALVIFTPLAFGTVEPWSIAITEVWIYAIALVWALSMVLSGEIRIGRSIFNLCWLLVLAFGLLQVIPLPLELIRIISPKASALYEETGFLDPLAHSWRTISLVPWATRRGFMRLLALALLFWASSNHLKSRDQVERMVRLIMISGFGLALFGIVQHFSGNGKLYWVRELTHGGPPFGPYVNKNHFAGYMEMVIPLTIGYIAANRRSTTDSTEGWRRRLVHWGSAQASRLLLAFFAGIIMTVALLLTGSKAGLFSFFCSMLFIGLLLSAGRWQGRRVWGMLASFVALGLTYALWLNPDRVIQTFAVLWRLTGDLRERILVWQDTLRLGHDFHWTGTGLDTYVWAFPLYKRPAVGQYVWEYAHNDYLQAYAEGGLALIAIFALAMLGGGTQLLGRWSASEEKWRRGLGLGLLAGLVAMLVHSVYDFNLHIMANAILFVLLLGLAAQVLPYNAVAKKEHVRLFKPPVAQKNVD